MKTIIHSIEKIMNADIHAYSYGIKLSYLLSDEVLVFGDIQYMINYIQLLNKYSLDDKVRVLHEDLKVKSPDLLFVTEIYLSTLKAYNKEKNHSPASIKNFVGIKYSIAGIIKDFVDGRAADVKRLGFSELNGLLEKGIMACYCIQEDERSNFHKKKEIILFSDLISLTIADKAKDTNILYLNDALYKQEIVKDYVFTNPLADNATDTSHSYLYPVAELPDLQLLSETELKTIRQQLKEANKDSRQLIDQWLVLCNTSDNKSEASLFFKHNVIPAIPAFSNTFHTHPLLRVWTIVIKNISSIFLWEKSPKLCY